MKLLQLNFIFLLSILLSACGGGGSGGDNPPTPTPTPQPDLTPDSVQFDNYETQTGTDVVRIFDVTGISQPVPITIEGGQYSIDGGAYTDLASSVSDGQVVSVRVTASEKFSTVTTAIVSIGDAQVEISAVSEAEDKIPDSIENLVAIQQRNAVFERTFTITGINTEVDVSLDAGELAIDDGAYMTTAGVIAANQQLSLRVSASPDFSQTVAVNLVIGDSVFTFNVITEDEDLVPDTFTFDDQVDVAPDSIIDTQEVTITGINNASPISITGGEYSIDGGAYTSSAGMIDIDQTLMVRQTASSEFEASTTASLHISTLVVDFTATTHSEKTPPEGGITFPWRTTISHQDTVIVRGSAADASGIQTITLGGETVTIDSTTQETDMVVVEWSHEISVPTTMSRFNLEITDTKGNISVNNDSFEIGKSIETPYHLVLDEEQSRLIGYTLESGLITYDYASQTLEKLGNHYLRNPYASCLRPSTEELFFVDYKDSSWHFQSLNLTSNLISTYATLPYPGTEYDLSAQISFYDMECDTDHVYLLMEATLLDSTKTSRIVELDLTSTPVATELLETGDTNAGAWTANHMHLAGGVIVTGTKYGSSQVQKIRLSDLQISDASSDTFLIHDLIHDPDNNAIYVVGKDEISSIDTTTEATSIISATSTSNFIRFESNQSSALMKERNSILLRSSFLDALVEVSLETGDRSIFMKESIGNGDGVFWGDSFVVSNDQQYAYILDHGDATNALIWQVNLQTGMRTMLWRSLGAHSAYSQDIALDNENNILYWGLDGRIYSYDIDNFILEDVASLSKGYGVTLSSNFSIAFDQPNNRILVLDTTQSALIDVNLDTLERSIISKEGIAGSGPAISSPIAAGLALSLNSSSIYFTNQSTSSIYAIDLSNGDRSEFISECLNESSVNLFDGLQILDLSFDTVSNQIFIWGGTLLRYDLNSGVCYELGENLNYKDIQVMSDQGLLGLGNNEIYSVDIKTGAGTILSK